MERNQKLGKTEKRTLATIAFMVVVGLVSWYISGQIQQDVSQNRIANATTIAPYGEELLASPFEETDAHVANILPWDGTVTFRVLSAELYDNYEAATTAHSFARLIDNPASPTKSAYPFLVCTLEIKNIDATMTTHGYDENKQPDNEEILHLSGLMLSRDGFSFYPSAYASSTEFPTSQAYIPFYPGDTVTVELGYTLPDISDDATPEIPNDPSMYLYLLTRLDRLALPSLTELSAAEAKTN